jgi:hypothetical protein
MELVDLIGQYSNPGGPLKALLEAIFEIPERPSRPATEARRATLRQLRLGALRAAVLIVLGETKQPIRVREVHAAVAQRLQIAVSYETIKSALSAASRNPATGVERVRWGVYQGGHSVAEDVDGP